MLLRFSLFVIPLFDFDRVFFSFLINENLAVFAMPPLGELNRISSDATPGLILSLGWRI